MPRHFLSAFLFLAATAASPLAAQGTAEALESLPDSARVRVTVRGQPPMRVVGRLTEVRGDTAFLARKGRLLAVPLSSVLRAEVSRGRNHLGGIIPGLAYGAAGGAVLGGALVYFGPRDCDYCLVGGDLGNAAIGAVVVGLLLAPPGALVGLIVGTEDWRPAGERRTLRVVPAPDGRLGVGFSIQAPRAAQ